MILVLLGLYISSCSGDSSFSLKPFFHTPKIFSQPQLVLISGPTGTGKSTFGMSLALSRGILRCISTDTIRQVMRTYDLSPALHRSSYSGNGDAIINWRECCEVLDDSIESVVSDAMKRGVSIVIEGVHVVPSNKLINNWRERGGKALGCVLTITDEAEHKKLISKRGEITRKGSDQQVKAFSRIRTIQSEMIRLAKLNNWLMIEQKVEPDPIDIVTELLVSQ
eukprot:gene17581-23151_t